MWADGSADFGDDVTFIGWGAELEHQFKSYGGDGAVNGFIRYDGRYAESDWGGGTDTMTGHTILVGFSFDLNAANLLQRERYGVALDTPNFGRVLAHVNSTD